MLLLKEAVPQAHQLRLDFKADHKAASAVFHQGRVSLELLLEPGSQLGGMLHQLLLLNHLQHGNSRCTGNVIAAKSSSQQAEGSLNLRRNEDGTNGDTSGQAFGHGNEVSLNAGILMGKEFTRTAAAGLDFIGHQKSSRAVAEGAEVLEEGVGGNADARHTLDTFNDDGSVSLGLQLLLGGLQISQGNEGHLLSSVEGSTDLGVVRYADGTAGASMESSAKGEDLGSARMEGSQFEGVLVGFGPAVAEEKMILGIAADLSQFLGQGVLEAILDRVGIEAQLGNLLGDGLYIMRMAVANTDDGVSAIKVQVLLTLSVPQFGATTAYGLNVPPFIYVE